LVAFARPSELCNIRRIAGLAHLLRAWKNFHAATMSLKNDNVIDGKAIAQQCREDTAKEVAALKARYGKVHSNHEAAPSMY
jgi:hypothetical protein